MSLHDRTLYLIASFIQLSESNNREMVEMFMEYLCTPEHENIRFPMPSLEETFHIRKTNQRFPDALQNFLVQYCPTSSLTQSHSSKTTKCRQKTRQYLDNSVLQRGIANTGLNIFCILTVSPAQISITWYCTSYTPPLSIDITSSSAPQTNQVLHTLRSVWAWQRAGRW